MVGNLGHIAATVSLNIDPFKASARVLNSTIKATTAELKAQDAAFKGSEKSVAGMRTVYATMSKQLDNYRAKMAQQKQVFDTASASLEKHTKAADLSASSMDKLQTRVANAASAYNRTSAQASVLEQKMFQLSKTTNYQNSAWHKIGAGALAASKAFGTAGEKLSSFGSKATTRVTAPVIAGFAGAAKAAIDFDSQIAAMGPLLTNGGKVTAQFKGQLDQLADASKKWAMQYGISTSAINEGMSEMIKRGYTAAQTLGAMPAVLDATKASGDDFNDVMHVSTSVLEQFGLKSESTTAMLRNTSRVTDTLTYVANATAAGFQDMGEAMTYVGPTAHAAGISLEETAAAIGIMSNRGIEGSVAGTVLRSALTRLMNPTKQNIQGFKELGVNVSDFKKGTLTLPEIIDKIKNNTKGWTDQQRAAAIAMAFGTQAQAGMNALIAAGGDELRHYTKAAQGASGTTKQIADQLNDTQAAKISKFKESIHVLAITFGEKLLPTLTPVIQTLTKMMTQFANLDPEMQKSILKWVAMAAAVGPASKVLGSAFTIISKGGSVFGKTAEGIARASGAAKAGAGGFDVLKSLFSKSAFEAAKMGASATTMGASVTKAGVASAGLASSLGAALPILGGVALAVGAGVAVWELWGKKAYETQKITEVWGTTVSSATAKSLSSVRSFKTEASTALASFSTDAKTSSSTIKQSLQGMFDEMKSYSKKSLDEAKKNLKGLPESVQSSLKESIDKKKAADVKILASQKELNERVNGIIKKAASEHRDLTDDEQQYIQNALSKSSENQINLLNVSESKKKALLAAMNDDYSSMTKGQAEARYEELKSALGKEDKLYQKQQDQIKSLYDKGLISQSQYKTSLEQLATSHQNVSDKIIASMYKAAKASGYADDIIANEFAFLGVSMDQVHAALDRTASKAENTNSRLADTSSKFGKAAQKAGEAWNNLILNPKTGEIKTNAQQAVNDFAKSDQGWKQLNFVMKHAKISSNAKEMIAEAAIASGRWDTMSWKEKRALIKSNASEQMEKSLESNGTWNSLTYQQKSAIVNAEGLPQLAELVIKYGLWNKLPDSMKKILVDDSDAKQKLLSANIDLSKYDQKKPGVKILTADKTPLDQAIVGGFGGIEKYNSKKPNVKEFLGNSKDLLQKSQQGQKAVDDFNNKKEKQKYFKGDSSDVDKKSRQGQKSVTDFNIKKEQQKHFKGDASNVTNQSNRGKQAVSAFNTYREQLKHFKGESKGVNDAAWSGKQAINQFNGVVPVLKHMKANDEASYNAHNAKNGVDAFLNSGGGRNTITKTLQVVANVGAGVAKLLGLEKGTQDLPADTLAMVNDQRGSLYQEAIMTPKGSLLFPQGRNVILPIPKHSRVFTASETKRFFNIPKFATGTLDFGGAANRINKVQPEVFRSVPTTVITESKPLTANQTINVEVKVEGNATKDDAKRIADVVTEELRKQTYDKLTFDGR